MTTLLQVVEGFWVVAFVVLGFLVVAAGAAFIVAIFRAVSRHNDARWPQQQPSPYATLDYRGGAGKKVQS